MWVLPALPDIWLAWTLSHTSNSAEWLGARAEPIWLFSRRSGSSSCLHTAGLAGLGSRTDSRVEGLFPHLQQPPLSLLSKYIPEHQLGLFLNHFLRVFSV